MLTVLGQLGHSLSCGDLVEVAGRWADQVQGRGSAAGRRPGRLKPGSASCTQWDSTVVIRWTVDLKEASVKLPVSIESSWSVRWIVVVACSYVELCRHSADHHHLGNHDFRKVQPHQNFVLYAF